MIFLLFFILKSKWGLSNIEQKRHLNAGKDDHSNGVQSSQRVVAQASKIALGPVKIRPTGQQNLTKNFKKLSCGTVDKAVQREDWV